MEDLIRQLYQDRAGERDTLAIVVVEKEYHPLSITDGFDVIILLVNQNTDITWDVKHYTVANKYVSFHSLSQAMVHQTLIIGNHRRLIDWIINGKIMFDRNEFLQEVKERIDIFPPGDRAKKMTIQFTKMLRRFEEGKTLFRSGHLFDAFSNMMHSLHHLARLSVIHHGLFPEVIVWEQVRYIEPQIYKLYHELLHSEESLEKRIELLILATELAIHSKTEVGSQHFLSVIQSMNKEWSASELMGLSELSDYRLDIELLVRHLLEKRILTSETEDTRAVGINKIKYLLK
ncbi:nucleotidyltransferase-like protein [Bacillus suaedae]|uniref:Nucleotidyltransferase-like domain-containing protein n=1 Tax=Halalkalibacter suaedae TaxID=2822140 RepID=A0A941AQ85_9BACI|nr:nucleotidyltransferase-like protein [Bacillus suaedae]MBP3952347.1 hypothetical protein [Bacillus suaedae]